ncbi:hypothetical protein C0J52_02110 [Blattella germanica]|nr:hypothetical protein C0J52_02110 [Blattella germanica]
MLGKATMNDNDSNSLFHIYEYFLNELIRLIAVCKYGGNDMATENSGNNKIVKNENLYYLTKLEHKIKLLVKGIQF